jgi:hypothetical protein
MRWSTAETRSFQHVEVSYVRTKRMVLQGEGSRPDFHRRSWSTARSLIRRKILQAHGDSEAQGKRPGGFGILMATKLVDDLIYNEKGNEVLLVKYLDKPAAASGS